MNKEIRRQMIEDVMRIKAIIMMNGYPSRSGDPDTRTDNSRRGNL